MFVHAKNANFQLADLGGAIQDISVFGNDVKFASKTDRPVTQYFTKLGEKRELTGLREATVALAGPYSHVLQGAGLPGVKLHGRMVRLIHNQYALTSPAVATQGDILKGNVKREIKLDPTQMCGDNYKRYATNGKGLMKATGKLDGLFDSAAGGIDLAFRASVGVDPPGQDVDSIGMNGFAIGNVVEMIQTVMPAYNVNASAEKLVDVSGDYTSDDQYDVGYSLHDLVAEVGAPPVNYASVDHTDVTTSNGWVAHLHVVLLTGTNIVVKMQDSADNATFADLANGTFASATGPSVQRLDGGNSATVRRYVRAVAFSGTFTSVTFQVSFSRRGFITIVPGTHRHFCGLITYGMPSFQGTLGNNSGFKFGPEGNAVGKRRFQAAGGAYPAGGLVLKDYDAQFDENGMTKYVANFLTDGPWIEDTF